MRNEVECEGFSIFGVALKSEWRRFGRIDVLFNVVFVFEFVGICCVIVH